MIHSKIAYKNPPTDLWYQMDACKTVKPPYEISRREVFAYCFDIVASKAPSDEGAVSEAD